MKKALITIAIIDIKKISVFLILLLGLSFSVAYGKASNGQLKIVTHQRKLSTEIIEGDIWMHVEGKIYNPYGKGVKNVVIVYTHMEGLPPIKINFIPPKQTVDYKSTEAPVLRGANRMGVANPMPLVKDDDSGPDGHMTTKITFEFDK